MYSLAIELYFSWVTSLKLSVINIPFPCDDELGLTMYFLPGLACIATYKSDRSWGSTNDKGQNP